jgi:hypothetical protein
MFFPDIFLDKHWPVIDVIERMADDLLRGYAEGETAGLNSLAAILKDNLHDLIALKTSRLWHCPYCKWNQLRFAGMEEQTS